MVGGVAVIKVGAATEITMKKRKALVESALHATRAAIEEGIVPGGGVALFRCIPALDRLKADGDEQLGVNIVKRALEEPLRIIATNAGQEADMVVGKVKSNNNLNYGFNAQTGTLGDLVEASIIEPTKVTRCALQNAASIASLTLTTEAQLPREGWN
jgi:chaperonin GroEL